MDPTSIMTKLTGLVTMIGALIEAAVNKAPARIIVDGVLRSIMPARRVAVVSVSVAASGTNYTGQFQKGDDVVIDHITAYTADAAALNAFRLSLQDENGTHLLVSQDKAKDGTLTSPRGSQILPSTSDALSDRPSLMFFLPKEQYLNLVLLNASGTPTYTVELTVHYRVVKPGAA